ncbi:MAG: sodium ion-translocating decarboxylase subunit beta, partial [Syntrophales bacterium LBB04]|nr:sodium ion-translocating decarboxylase subunit beta [Syntrophales bacterium LBB04]
MAVNSKPNPTLRYGLILILFILFPFCLFKYTKYILFMVNMAAIGVIGACDGPTAIYVSSKYAPHLLGPISVAAYSYMSLVPLLQPIIMRALTTQKERTIAMRGVAETVSRPVKVLFPVVVTIITCLIAPKGAPLMGMIMLGNLLRESGVVGRLVGAAEN